MYTGPIVLKDVLPKNLYEHFMCLHVGICLLMNEALVKKHAVYAEQLLEYFVQQSVEIYGQKFVAYNVHCLIHLTSVALKFGCLDQCSAYPFESYMQKIKRLVRSGKKPLTQVVRRLSEIKYSVLSMPRHQNLPCFKTSVPNNCFKLNTGKYCLVHDVLEGSMVTCEVFRQTTSLYSDPCDSRLLDVHKVDLRSTVMMQVSIKSLDAKAIFFKLDNVFGAVMPLMHTVC